MTDNEIESFFNNSDNKDFLNETLLSKGRPLKALLLESGLEDNNNHRVRVMKDLLIDYVEQLKPVSKSVETITQWIVYLTAHFYIIENEKSIDGILNSIKSYNQVRQIIGGEFEELISSSLISNLTSQDI